MNPVSDLTEPVHQIADIGDRHVAASAAALDKVDGCLAEERHSRARGKRKQPALILQKDRSLFRYLL